MDAAADYGATLLCGGKGGRHQRADRREDQRRVERIGRRLVRAPGPLRAQRAGELLRGEIARAGEGEQPAALMADDLRDDVGGGAKTVDPDQLRVPGHAQGAVADEAGAHQRRRFDVAVTQVDRKAIALVGDGQLSIAAIDLVAGEAGTVAQILAGRAAILAHPAGPAEPRHADSVADPETVDRFSLFDDRADDLVPGDQWQFR